MHILLEKLFKKKGIIDATELDIDEKRDFDNWQRILSKEKLEIDDLRSFCQSQIEVIEGKWRDLTLEQVKKAEMIPYHTVYKTLLQAMNSPMIAREQLEKQLLSLIGE